MSMTFVHGWIERDASRHPADQRAQVVVVSCRKSGKSPFPASPETLKKLNGMTFVYPTNSHCLVPDDTIR